MKRGADISAILRPLSERQSQAYLSNQVQLADLLEWILAQTGRAEVFQTSFSISEEFLRRLWHISKSGLISRFSLVLDNKATQKTLRLWVFISQVIQRTFLADNHSKVLLVKPVTGPSVAVITSQNLTRGNRFESSFITTDPAVCSSLMAAVSDIIDNHSVPLHDLLGQRLDAD